jgi:hypothetical protein
MRNVLEDITGVGRRDVLWPEDMLMIVRVVSKKLCHKEPVSFQVEQDAVVCEVWCKILA